MVDILFINWRDELMEKRIRWRTEDDGGTGKQA